MNGSSAVQVQWENKQVTFDELPDELVVLIFSHLSPEDLACHASQVCLRWHSIAKDPILWENSILRYDESNHLEFQKTMHFAPMLSKLEMNMFQHISNATLQSILSGCVSVKYLSFYPSTSVLVDVRLSILNRFSTTLEGLNMFLDDSYLMSCNTNILSCMDKLEELTLRGSITNHLSISGLFQNGLKNLKVLDINGLTILSDSPGLNSSPVWQNFVLKIVEYKGLTLKKLSLPSGVFNFSTISLIENMFLSSSIEDLKICEIGLWAVKRLNALKTLHITGMSLKYLDCLRKDCLLSTLHYNVLFEWINRTPQFLGVRNLVLEYIFDDEREIISHLLNACRNLKSLTLISSCHSTAQLSSIITRLPSLIYLNIHRMDCLRSRHLDLVVSHLPNLSVINLRHNNLTDGILQYYKDSVQAKMPDLQLQCDWGYWSINGGQKWPSVKSCRPPFLLPKSKKAKCDPSSSSNLSLDERNRIRIMLEAINEYEDDD